MDLDNKLAPYFNGANIEWVLGALSPELKQTEREAQHSPPTCVDVTLFLQTPICLHDTVLNTTHKNQYLTRFSRGLLATDLSALRYV